MFPQYPDSTSIVQNITGALESDSSSSTMNGRSQISAQVHSLPVPRRYRRDKSDWYSGKLVTVAPHNIDHHEWVKYGEKKINGFKFPRYYYRCTYHKDGCQAKKQVQEQERGDPPTYLVTYKGEHTCKIPTLLDRQLMMRDCISKLAQEQLRSYSETKFLNFASNASYPVAHHTTGARPTEPVSLCSSSKLHGTQQERRDPVLSTNSLDQDPAEETICIFDDQQKDICTLNKHASENVNFLESPEGEPDLFADYGLDNLFPWSGVDDATFSGANLWDNSSGIFKEMENDVREKFDIDLS